MLFDSSAQDKLEKFKEMISECNKIVFFGGAGVSTESGIPDFRSKDGLYNQRDVKFDKYSPEYLLSHSCLRDNPRVFYEFYRQKLDVRTIEPNVTHYKLAELEKQGKLMAVITQNIDGLHQKAGSEKVYEIHGTTMKNYCDRCGKKYPSDYIFNCKTDIPNCSCGGKVRPDVTLYEETLPDDAWAGAVHALISADMLIIAGTSLTVYPAAGMVQYFKGKYLVVINKSSLSNMGGRKPDLVFNESMGRVFEQI